MILKKSFHIHYFITKMFSKNSKEDNNKINLDSKKRLKKRKEKKRRERDNKLYRIKY
jgi:hypothetical protein